MAYHIVLDTNVIVAGLKSRLGASFRILERLGDPQFRIHLTVPLVLEYEAVAKRPGLRLPFSPAEIDDFIDSLCTVGENHAIFFLWRPHLRDPGDDLVLEAAIAGRCQYIVTYNLRDFERSQDFGVVAITPADFLRILGARK